MAVEKMKLLSIVGKVDTMDTFIEQYLLQSGMQPEDALKVFEKSWNLSYFDYDITPKEEAKKCKNLLKELEIEKIVSSDKQFIRDSKQELSEKLQIIEKQYLEIKNEIVQCQETLENIEKSYLPIEHLRNIDINLSELYTMRYARFRYGKISKENFEKVKEEIPKIDALIFEVEEEEENIWIIYITTSEFSQKVDSYFNVMKFERIWIPEEIKGKASRFLDEIETYEQKLNQKLQTLEQQFEQFKKEIQEDLVDIYIQLETYIKINNVKKFMAHDDKGSFYMIGWMPIDELKQLVPVLEQDEEIKYVVKSHDEVASVPPSHLKNNKIFKPFESIVKMYGIPNYTEMDPTVFVAITAFIMFGFMFGDVGHGLVIFLIGIFLRFKKNTMGHIFAYGGISAMIFGVLYGSVFGREDIIKSLVISPMENIETMLISGIAMGVILIVIAMILNIKNGLKNKDKKRIFLDENGVMGLAFYSIIIFAIVYFFLKGKLFLPISLIIIFAVIPLIAIMFKDEIAAKLSKKKQEHKTSIIEKIFELIEILLSIVSNTVSFVRLAAFAINHVGLCMAVYILSGMANASGSIIIAIIGNILVIVLEGLIVGIQVLRLEYYELFSRFYQGDGKEYKPLKAQINP